MNWVILVIHQLDYGGEPAHQVHMHTVQLGYFREKF